MLARWHARQKLRPPSSLITSRITVFDPRDPPVLKINPKTLAVIWGCFRVTRHARSMGRGGIGRSVKGSGKGGSTRAFGGGGYASFHDYMAEKNRKLKEQFGEFASGVVPHDQPGKEQDDAVNAGEPASLAEAIAPKSSTAQLFKGLTFWMTGRTCLPDQ
eukprot:6484629-Amphidinium_carterae.1